MGAFSIWHIAGLLIIVALLVFPIVRILQKAGFSGWWAALLFIPWANIIGLWVFASIRWKHERPEEHF